MPFASNRTIAEYSKRAVLDQGRTVRYSNPGRRRGMVALLMIAAVAISFILLKGGPEGPALVVFFFPLWIIFSLAFGWTRVELTLDRDRRHVKLVRSPLVGDMETREINGDEVAAVELVKDEAWEVWIQSEKKGSRFLDSSDEEEEMRRLARDLSEVLGVPTREKPLESGVKSEPG